jgi:hypothetical protein
MKPGSTRFSSRTNGTKGVVGQAKIIERDPNIIFDSSRTTIACSLCFPEKHDDQIIDDLVRVFDYTGTFDFLKK